MPFKVEIIAEVAQAHDGSLGILHSYIDAAAEAGVDTIKFQTHIAEAESSPLEQFRVNFSYVDATRFDYWQRMEFTAEQWEGIKRHCEEKGISFLSSPFSVKAVELLEKIGVSRYKIGSGEISNYLMLHHIAKTGKPIILSTGMSDLNELDETIAFLKPYRNALSILQCNTEYPTPPENLGLNVLQDMKARYPFPIGLSDHSGTTWAPLAAVALGAELLEFHITFDRRMFGPDAKASLTIDETAELVRGVRYLEQALNNPVDKNANALKFEKVKTIFGKALAVNRDMSANETIELADLESKKPGDAGIAARHYQTIIGKKLKVDLKQNSFLKEEFLA